MGKRGKKQIIIPPSDIHKIESMAATGLTIEQIRNNLGYKKTTYYKNKKINAEIAEAIKRGESKGIAVATSKLFEGIQKNNLTAIIFFLKCRAGWKETNVTELTGQDGKPITHKHSYETSRKSIISGVLTGAPQIESGSDTLEDPNRTLIEDKV